MTSSFAWLDRPALPQICQEETRGKWDELVAGRYDWAHLAMRPWPERVVPKCAADRSLTIAHRLEDALWAEGRDGRWAKRPRPTRPVEELVAEQTTSAMKAAPWRCWRHRRRWAKRGEDMGGRPG